MNPRTVSKAASMAVAPRRDGSYDVAGRSDTYRVFVDPINAQELYCNCQAGRTGARCSHKLAVVFYRQRTTKAVV